MAANLCGTVEASDYDDVSLCLIAGTMGGTIAKDGCEGDRSTNPPLTNHHQADQSQSKNDDDDKVLPSALSKNERRRRERREHKRQVKIEKKQKLREATRRQAESEGRDWQAEQDAEQKFVQARTQAGDRQRCLDEVWKEKLQKASSSFGICIDCSFEKNLHAMNEREVASLAQQIRYCYAYNKKDPHPHFVSVTGLKQTDSDAEGNNGNEKTGCWELLKKEVGYERWQHRGFTCTGVPLEEYYRTNTHPPPTKDDMVYLTSDATATLDRLDDSKIYIIGGVVDRNRLKRAAIERAEALGIATAKLPLDEFYQSHPLFREKGATKVLAVNHVFAILLRVHCYGGKDWNRALEEVLPSRKQQKK